MARPAGQRKMQWSESFIAGDGGLVSQLTLDFQPPEQGAVRKFLRQLKDAAFDIIPLVVTLLLVIDFSIKEILPLVHLILHDLGVI
jgi:hypothetical protein